jgi:hypothetical protein
VGGDHEPKRAWLLSPKQTGYAIKTNTPDTINATGYKYILFIILPRCVSW